MNKKNIVQIDANTGEELRGSLVWIEDKPKSLGHFVKTYQNGMIEIAKYRLTGEAYSVLLFLLGKLSFDNWINITQSEIGRELGIVQQNVSIAMKVLVEKKIILEGPKKGRCNTYRLNYAVGYKGDEGRATKGGFRVLDGGKSNSKPTAILPEPVPTPTQNVE